MITLGTTGRVWVCVAPVDARKSSDGLAGVIAAALGKDPASGDLFVFRNRRGDQLKVLAWQGDGFAIYMRRLEAGTFAFPAADTPDVTVTPTQLAMIPGGVELAGTRTRKRYARPAPAPGAEIPPDPRNSPAPAGV